MQNLPKDWTHILCLGRPILYHWTTREVPTSSSLMESITPWLGFSNYLGSTWKLPSFNAFIPLPPLSRYFFQGIFIWLHCVLVATGEFLSSLGIQTLSWSMWHLIPWPGIEPGLPALRAQSLSHCATRDFIPCPTRSRFPCHSLSPFPPCRSRNGRENHLERPSLYSSDDTTAQPFLCNSSLKAPVMLF